MAKQTAISGNTVVLKMVATRLQQWVKRNDNVDDDEDISDSASDISSSTNNDVIVLQQSVTEAELGVWRAQCKREPKTGIWLEDQNRSTIPKSAFPFLEKSRIQ